MESRGRGGGGGGPSRRPVAGAGRTPHEVKVTHIVTTEVSTDEANFKDVVQRLTGKDSAAARAAAVADGGSSRSSDVRMEGGGGTTGVHRRTGTVLFDDTVDGGALPSLEEMQRWWGVQD